MSLDKAELLKQQGRRPRLLAQFPHAAKPLRYKIAAPDQNPAEFVDEEMKKIREEFPVREIPSRPSGAYDLYGFAAAMPDFSQPHITQRNSMNSKYQDEYREYLDRLLAHQASVRRTFRVDFHVRNAGDGDADDVHLLLTIPNGVRVFDARSQPRKPSAPSTPGMFAALAAPVPARADVRQLADVYDWPEISGQEVAFQIARVKHDMSYEKLKSLFLLVPGPGGFQIRYRLNTATADGDAEGELHIVVE